MWLESALNAAIITTNKTELERPAGVYHVALLLFQRISPHVKCQKFAKNFKSKISEICSTVLCILAHKKCVTSFIKIREKLQEE